MKVFIEKYNYGKKYNITRERVRQIEDVALKSIKKSEAYKGEQAVFEEIKQLLDIRHD